MIRVFMILVFLLVGCGDIAKSLEEGRTYGKGHTLGECSKESMSRLNACEGVACVAANMGFPRGCTKTARSDRRFCSSAAGGVTEVATTLKQTCAGHKFEKACYKYKQLPIARCLNERAS